MDGPPRKAILYLFMLIMEVNRLKPDVCGGLTPHTHLMKTGIHPLSQTVNAEPDRTSLYSGSRNAVLQDVLHRL